MRKAAHRAHSFAQYANEWGTRPELSCLSDSEDLTVYKFDYTSVDEKPETIFMCLKRLVGERGFEPPTPWSRTRFEAVLKSPEIWRFQVVCFVSVAGSI